MNCHSVSPLMSSALYQAGIRFNPSVPQPVLLGKFYFGCPGGGYGPSKTTLKNHVLGNMCLHTPGVSASWKNRAYSSYWLDALSLFKNEVAIQVFKFAPRPVVAFQVNLDWHLLCRALWCTSEKDGAFFFHKAGGSFHRKSQPPVKEMLFCLLLTHPKTSWEDPTLHPPYFLYWEIHVNFKLGKKIKHRIAGSFPANTSTEQV